MVTFLPFRAYNTDNQLIIDSVSVMRTLKKFPEHREELLEMFYYKMENLVNPKLWE